jgi:hypothetical protein
MVVMQLMRQGIGVVLYLTNKFRIYIKNRIGETGEPYGIPVLIAVLVAVFPSNFGFQFAL